MNAPLTAIEQLILRNIRDDDHKRGVTDANRGEHDQALFGLIARDLVRYNPRRPTDRFALTVHGKAAIAEADVQLGAVFQGQALSPAERVKLFSMTAPAAVVSKASKP